MGGGVGWGGKVNLMSAPGPCLVQGAIGPGARDRGLALDNNNLLLIATDVTMEVGYDNRKFTLIFEVNIGDDLVNFNCLEENVNYKFFEGHYVVDVGGPLV